MPQIGMMALLPVVCSILVEHAAVPNTVSRCACFVSTLAETSENQVSVCSEVGWMASNSTVRCGMTWCEVCGVVTSSDVVGRGVMLCAGLFAGSGTRHGLRPRLQHGRYACWCRGEHIVLPELRCQSRPYQGSCGLGPEPLVYRLAVRSCFV